MHNNLKVQEFLLIECLLFHNKLFLMHHKLLQAINQQLTFIITNNKQLDQTKIIVNLT